MSDEPIVLTEVRPIAIEVPPPVHVVDTTIPTEEEVRMADDVFTRRDPEAEAAAGLMSMQAGILVLHAIALETFEPTAPEEEVEQPKPRKPKLESK